jgi:hypothetical protein
MCHSIRLRFILIFPILLLTMGLAVLFIAGCGGDDDPTAPVVVPSGDEDIPEIPKLSGPLADPPIRSESAIALKPATDYYPDISTLNGHVLVKAQGRYGSTSGAWINCYGDWNNSVFDADGWTNDLPQVGSARLDACGLLSAYTYKNFSVSVENLPFEKRVGLLSEGQIVSEPGMISWTTGWGWEVCRERLFGACTSKVWRKMKYEVTGQELEAPPYIRRERFWQATPWESGNLVEGLNGTGSIQGTTSYTSGSSVAETESMALTIGSEVGGEFEGFSAKVSTSLTTTFSTTVTVSRSATTSFTRTLEGVEGKRTRFVLWVLRERYSFANEDGTPFTDPNYVVDKGIQDPVTEQFYLFEISGGQAEATKYIFNMKSDKLLGTVLLD